MATTQGFGEGLQEAIQSVLLGVGPSVVGVAGRRSAGSGLVLASGRVLTNAHNVTDGTLTVTFGNGRTVEGTPIGVDPEGDVAVLDVDTGEVKPLEWNGASPGVGAPVFAVANPAGRGLRVTYGLMSGLERSFHGPRGRRITGSIEHTAPLLPGSSGGPIVDADGHLLGINTHRLGEGFYLAIPADEALRTRIDALSRGEEPSKLRLGVAVAPSDVARRLRRAVGLPEADGLLVRGVEEGSPAERAGLKEGDLITTAGGRELRTHDDLFAPLDAATGGTLELAILRGTEAKTLAVEFGG
jgi:serine protease Do